MARYLRLLAEPAECGGGEPPTSPAGNCGGGVGVFVPFRDSASLAATIADLLDDPIRIAAHNLRAHAANMAWAKVAAAHLNLARSIAGG